jgi:3-hydroxymyristoyl/3-hydroxydecanoyl-(acyl carrier protein) dehydratase
MHPARPGDQLIIEVNIPEGHSRFGRGEGFLRVGDKKLCQVSMKFALVDPPSASEENKA